VGVAFSVWLAVQTACTGAPAQQPYEADARTGVLLHLDGDANDAGGAENHGKVQGDAAWAEGKFGGALALDGRGGVVIPGSGTTYVGDSSWTVECWFRPEPQQPLHAVLVGSGWGYERDWSLRISNMKHLAAVFSCGSRSAVVSSSDVAATLFDGQWHHAAAVLDRRRGGEVRLYLDGKRIPCERPAFCGPIVFDDQRMGIVVGAMTPWGIGKDGYRGRIDEVRISNIVRPPFDVNEPLPEDVARQLAPRPAMPVDDAMAHGPLALSPERTLIVLPDRRPAEGNFEAARELQRWLRAARGVEQGFEIVQEAKVDSIAGKSVVALGWSQWIDEKELSPLPPFAFLLRRRANVVVIAGAQSTGTYLGTMRFLDEICGVRFYMPTDLFTSAPKPEPAVPEGYAVRVVPFVRSGLMTGIGGIPGDGGWTTRNAASRRLGGTHQHSMYAVFPPERFAEDRPEIYPELDGRRYIPASGNDQRWQPCLSAPTLVDAAEDSAVRYFRKEPQADYLAFCVQDANVVCQCERCRAEYEKHKAGGAEVPEHEARGFSTLYWRFIDSLARRLQEKTPGKKIVAMVYGPARFPPQKPLPPNVVLFTNFHIAEMDADRILAPDPATGVSRLDHVLGQCSFYGNHDWYHGNGFLMPRIYSGYWSRFMRRLAERVEGAYMHVEAYPNWGLDGPKLYIAAQLWSDPRADVDRLLRRFCDDMFGPAADPMREYFTTLEKLWVTLDNVKGPERKLFRWDRQFTIDVDDRAVVARLRELLDRASAAATTDHQRQRIALFSKTFAVPETLYRFAAAEKIPQSDVDAFRARVDKEILPDPMTLYGAGPKPDDLRKNIESALQSVTNQGKKTLK